jgi:transcriptional regulator with XRE-family HTH domain
MPADWTGVSGRIRARRTELGISQQEAASRAGISVRVAAKYETEIPPSGPDLATLEKLAGALTVSPAWLRFARQLAHRVHDKPANESAGKEASAGRHPLLHAPTVAPRTVGVRERSHISSVLGLTC